MLGPCRFSSIESQEVAIKFDRRMPIQITDSAE